MNVPMSWLRGLTGVSEEINSFTDKMTSRGTKVEGLTRPGHEISGVVTGRIIAIDKHPNADKLLITKADTGEKVLQIVTGAQNLKAGDVVPVATDGAVLAEGKRIKKSKMRGEESDGMLCSIEELGYTKHDYPEAPEGIYVLTEEVYGNVPLGADVKPIMELTDEVIDFEIMSNRPDCNSVIGVAKEVSAVYGVPLAIPEIKVNAAAGGQASDYIAVEIKNADLCPRYAARVVKNVKIGPSPLWMRHRLTASGVRPVNNIVDITNYVMLEYGQPLHAFDIEGIAARDGVHKIIVRNAEHGETFTTLDGTTRKLDETMLVISDTEKAVAIAGIMGGENSKVTESASAVLFESANFNNVNIRHTSKKLGLRTDASAKYEKGVDPNLAETAVNRAMQLTELLACGEVVPGIADCYPLPRVAHSVTYNPGRVNALIGINLTETEIESLLKKVGIEAKDGTATVPTCRQDVCCEADIAEEVARMYGYDNVPSVITQAVSSPGMKTPKQQREQALRENLAGLGYCEAVTYPFEGPSAFEKLMLPQDDERRNAIRILNPLSEEYSVMRTQTVNALLECMAVNVKRAESARLFENAFEYIPKALPLTELPEERNVLTLMSYDLKGTDFYEIKGDVEELLASVGVKNPVFAAHEGFPFTHPGRTAVFSTAETSAGAPVPLAVPLGWVAEIHPKVLENYEINTRVYAAVINLDTLHACAEKYRPAFVPLPKYPSVNRDIALLVKNEVTAADIESAIKERGGRLLSEIRLFDVYQGKQVAEGFKSMAYSLRFRASDRSLADEDIQKPMRVILSHLQKLLGAELRDK